MLILTTLSPKQAKAGNSKIEYAEFFSEYQNFYLFHPELIKETFWGLAKPKYNNKLNRRTIEQHIFACGESYSNKTCYYDQTVFERQDKKIPKVITIPVSFSKIAVEKISKYNRQITLSWEPESFNSPTIKASFFRKLTNLAENSRYYQFRSNIQNIKFNIVFPKEFNFILNKSFADNIIEFGRECENRRCSKVISGAYKNIPNDKKDEIFLTFKEADFNVSDTIISINMYLKVVKIKLNHQFYKINN